MVDINPEIDEEAFEYLRNYKYSTGEKTILDKHMDIFWCWLAKFIPKVRIST